MEETYNNAGFQIKRTEGEKKIVLHIMQKRCIIVPSQRRYAEIRMKDFPPSAAGGEK